MNDEFIKRFTEACMKLCRGKGDYTKTNVIKHNIAMKKLAEIYNELSNDKNNAEIIYNELMSDDDKIIRMMAAFHSLSLNININKAEEVLREMIGNTDNTIEKFNAEMILKNWKEGKLTM